MHTEDEDFEDYPIGYSIDNAILMHRDIHFGGSFDVMIEYYGGLGKGISTDFELARIQELHQMEKSSRNNLSSVLLSGQEAEMVAEARDAYKKLQALYEVKNPKNPIPCLIADLIFAETEEDIQKAIDAVVAQKSAIVPALIDLLRNENFYNPLYPGYGFAPVLAAQCLGLIGDKRAIISLFEAVGTGDFFDEDTILEALYSIGEPARTFLLTVLHGKPLTIDNERAAIALIRFKDDPIVSQACLKMLQELDLKKELAIATYLVLACEGLPPSEHQKLLDIAKRPDTPKSLCQDIAIVVKNMKGEENRNTFFEGN